MATTGKKSRLLIRRLLLGAGALAAVALVALAAYWHQTLPLRRVAVTGVVRADSAEVVRLAALPDSTALYGLDPAVIADRVRRAPWVREARVRRRPTGTLAIAVEERAPAALVVGADGRPSHFLDAEGYSLPLRPHDPFDVPLLRGQVPAYHPTQPVESAALRGLLAALATAADETDALVSELALGPGGDALLHTTPSEAHGALIVRLGAADAAGYADRLRRLRAFWEGAVLTRPETRFAVLDLRFDGQVVAREADGPQTTVAEDRDPPSATDHGPRTTDP